MAGVFPEGMAYIHPHPAPDKTYKLQTTPSPMLEGQTEPIEVSELYKAFHQDLEGSLAKYQDKRFDVTGTVTWVGVDPHDLASVQLSDKADGNILTHCIFPSHDILNKVKVGEKVTIRANYLVLSNHWGIIMKFSELL